MKRFHPSRLFEAWKRDRGLAVYPTFEANLDAVRAGTKGLSMFSFPVSEMLARDGDYLDLVRLAFERGLVVVLQNEPIRGLPFHRQAPRVFVARPEELWRIPAFLALWKSAFEVGGWSDAAEAQESLLLGYTDAQRVAWRARQRYQHAAWGAPTIYTLLTAAQRRVVRSMGHRGFGSEDDVAGMTFLSHRGGTLKRDARRLLPPGLTLARAGLGRDAFDVLFRATKRRPARGLVTATVARAQAASVQAALASRVQILTRSGWV